MNVGFSLVAVANHFLFGAASLTGSSATNAPGFGPATVLQYVDSLKLGWFDGALAVVLFAGVVKGRKRGMSGETVDLLKWVAIVLVAGLLYGPIGREFYILARLSPLFGYISCYIGIAIVLRILFQIFKHSVGEKLVEGDFFGFWEYYLGMLAGAVRFFCILLFCLALLNARLYTDRELADQRKKQIESFDKTYFPTLGMIQHSVFKESWSGRMIKKYLRDQLIASTAPGGVSNDTLGRRREQELESISK